MTKKFVLLLVVVALNSDRAYSSIMKLVLVIINFGSVNACVHTELFSSSRFLVLS